MDNHNDSEGMLSVNVTRVGSVWFHLKPLDRDKQGRRLMGVARKVNVTGTLRRIDVDRTTLDARATCTRLKKLAHNGNLPN